MPHTILIADDDPSIRLVLKTAFEEEGWHTQLATDLPELEDALMASEADLLLTDVLMPSGNALNFLDKQEIKIPVIVMSAHATLGTAIHASKTGAFDYVSKPFDLGELVDKVKQGLQSNTIPSTRLVREDNRPSKQTSVERLVGQSAAMQDLYRTISRIVSTDLSVLIYGESGTGKEVVARSIHESSPRKDESFVAVNMAAIPSELIESELFGHEKGAFTGAIHNREGRFREAGHGTLFLDEIGDMPIAAQTRLLRVLQENEFRSVGGTRAIKSNVRIIAATHKNLKQRVKEGQFREDLYFRLHVVPLTVPPLRDRVKDIPLLIKHFSSKNSSQGFEVKNFPFETIEFLQNQPWHGNVRELEHFILRASALVAEKTVTPEVASKLLSLEKSETGENHTSHALSVGPSFTEKASMAEVASLQTGAKTPLQQIPSDRDSENITDAIKRHLNAYFAQHGDEYPPTGLYSRFLSAVERPLLERTLQATKGNQIKAAEILGLNRNTLRKKIQELKIDPQFYR